MTACEIHVLNVTFTNHKWTFYVGLYKNVIPKTKEIGLVACA